jgi:predicted nucleic acid-binding protein
MMLVLDASVVIDLLLRREPFYDRIKAYIRLTDWLAAPHLLDAEVAQVLRRFVLRRDITEQTAEEAIKDLQDFPIERYPHTALLPRVFSLRNGLTAYDALYLALAEALDAGLLTRDTAFEDISDTNVATTVIR